MSMNDTLQILSTNSNISTIFVENLFRKITLGCLLSCLSVFTVCGNILVLYAIQTEKHLRTVSNLFILSLTFADLAVGLFVMPLSAANIITGRWPFSSVICKMWLSIDYVASTASIFNLVLLSLDRYWAVVHPLRYLQKRTRKRATVFIVIVWFISSLWAPAVIFWSHIAPRYSDVIKQNECDTSFRLNKTFKTLTALVNFYFPLLTMIIISCRIMVAIRSRSKMELGRRLSSSTQKQMKRDRTYTNTSLRNDNLTSLKTENNDRRPSSTNIVQNPFESNTPDYQPISNQKVEPGQCFCSTCQTYTGDGNDNLWQLQEGPLKKSYSSLQKRLSFAQIKPISMIFSSTTNPKENKKHKNEDSFENTCNNGNRIRNSLSVSNNMKYTIIIDSNERPEKQLSKPMKLQHILRTSSIVSSFSDDNSDTVFSNSIEKSNAKEKTTIQSPAMSHRSSFTRTHFRYPSGDSNINNSFLKTPPSTTPAQDSITTMPNNSPINSSINNSNNMNCSTFFNNLINPSRSSSLQKELKAARQLGMLVGVFTVSWLPYFILFLVVAWCNHCVSDTVYTASIWLGYLNSTFNPLIYPLCNIHFRRAFQKICYCKHAKTKLPNLNALRELHALHTIRRRR